VDMVAGVMEERLSLKTMVKGKTGWLCADILNDSGTTSHITNNIDDFRNGIDPASGKPALVVANNSVAQTDGRGEAFGWADTVFYKAARKTLFSSAKLHKSEGGLSLLETDGSVYQFVNTETRALRWTFEMYENLYLLNPTLSPAYAMYLTGADELTYNIELDGACSGACEVTGTHRHHVLPLSRKDDLMQLLHWKLGHASEKAIREMVKKKMLSGLNVTLKDIGKLREPCTACLCGRSIHRASLGAIKRDTEIGTFSVDERGPFRTPDTKKNYYIRTFICDKTNYMIRFLFKEFTSAVAIEHVAAVQTELHRWKHAPLRQLRLDKASAFTSIDFKAFAAEQRIHLVDVPPQDKNANGIAEAYNLHLMNRVRTLLLGLPQSFWGYASNYDCLVHNSLPHRRNGSYGRTPYEMFTGRLPSFRLLEPFGVSGVYHSKDTDKAHPRGRTGWYVGATEHGFLVVDKERHGLPMETRDFVPEHRSSIRNVLDAISVDHVNKLFESFPMPATGEGSSNTWGAPAPAVSAGTVAAEQECAAAESKSCEMEEEQDLPGGVPLPIRAKIVRVIERRQTARVRKANRRLIEECSFVSELERESVLSV
jgi:hypothetical protein